MRRLLRDVAENREIGDVTTLADAGVMNLIKTGLTDTVGQRLIRRASRRGRPRWEDAGGAIDGAQRVHRRFRVSSCLRCRSGAGAGNRPAAPAGSQPDGSQASRPRRSRTPSGRSATAGSR